MSFKKVWLAAFGLFIVISTLWSLATPLGASPDENEHIVRAAAVVRGQMVDPDAPGRAPLDVVATVPEDYAASLKAPLCFAFDQRIAAGCERPFPASTTPVRAAIYVGRYPPLYYLAVGWPTLLFHNPTGFYLVRLVSAAICDALLALAVAVVATMLSSAVALAGLTVAITPMVVYLSAVVNPSSLEVASAVAFWAGLVAMGTRFREDPPRRLIALTTTAGASLTLARPISPVWTLAAIAVVAPLYLDAALVRRLVRRSDIRAGAAVLVIAAAATTGWTLAEHSLRTLPGVPAPAGSITTLLRGAIGNASGYVPQAVGMFGLAVPVPEVVVLAWVGMVATLAVLAWVRCTDRHERVCIGWALLVAACLPTVVVFAGARTHGYIGFGRYFLPLYAGVPILLGALLVRHRASDAGGDTDRRLGRLFVGIATAGQAVGFFWCLHRYLVGADGPVSPLATVLDGWRPPVPGLVLDVLFVAVMGGTWWITVRLLDALSEPGGRRSLLAGRRPADLIVGSGDGDRKWAELDGIRAVAVFVVTFYHLFIVFRPDWNPLKPSGGFLAVDVFFVVSGFLITTLLLSEREQHQRISLKAFYGRRALRLFPALAVLLLVVGALAILLPAERWAHPTKLALPWVVLYAGNWNGAFYGGVQPLGALGHTWSLSVEEQFYLIWPVVLILLCRRVRNLRRVAAGLVGVALAEDVYRYMALHRGWNIQRVYYGTDFHSDGLLIGCAVAFWFHARQGRPVSERAGRLVMAGAAIGTVGLAVMTMRLSFFVNDWSLWLGIPAACACTALMLSSIILRPLPGWSHLLRLRPLVWVGRRSYGIYLWVTADFLMLNGFAVDQLGRYWYNALLIAGSILIAAISYRYLELPFLRMKGRLRRVERLDPVDGLAVAGVHGPGREPVATAAAIEAG